MFNIFYLCNSVNAIKCNTDGWDATLVWVDNYSTYKKKMFRVIEEVKGNGWTFHDNVDMDGKLIDEDWFFIKEDAMQNKGCYNFIQWYDKNYKNCNYYYKMNKKDDNRVESIDIYHQGNIEIIMNNGICVTCRCGNITKEVAEEIKNKIGSALKKYDYFYNDLENRLHFANFDNDDNYIIEVDVDY
jgi:hypothetical protein